MNIHRHTTSYGFYSNYGQHVSGPGNITNAHNMTNAGHVATMNINAGQFVASSEADIQRFILENIAVKAIHDANNTGFELPKCYPGTRESIRSDLTKWVENPQRKYHLYWLYAPAGSGKTAIAKTLADTFSSPPSRYLLASFFFRKTSPHQNTEVRFVATIAYQIKTNLPQTSRFIVDAIKADTAIFQKDLQVQADKLILEPLRKAAEPSSAGERAKWPRLIIIDGLDECSGQDAQRKILDVVSHLVRHMTFPIAVFLSCRPEPHIRGAFQGEHLRKASLKICLPDTYNSHDDLQKFVVGKFEEIVKAHFHILRFPPDWPGKTVIDLLVEKSSRHFIYASTVMKYIGVENDNPIERLHIVLGSEQSSDGESPFGDLDALYRRILASVQEKHLPTVLRVLQVTLSQSDGQVGDHHPKSLRHTLVSFLGLEPGKLEYSLRNLEGVLIETQSTYIPSVKFHHASFSDFLLDENRSGPYFIDMAHAHAQFIVHLFPYILNVDDSSNRSTLSPPFNDPGFYVAFAIRFVLNRLPVAAPTVELHRTLYRLKETSTARKLIRNCNRYLDATWGLTGWDLVHKLATLLGELPFHDALPLKQGFLKEVKEYVAEGLRKYAEEPLRHLITLFMIDRSIPSSIRFPHGSHNLDATCRTFILSRFGIDNDVLQLDRTWLNLGESLRDRSFGTKDFHLWIFLRQLIEDIDYTPTPEAYAATSLCVLKCISDLSLSVVSVSDNQEFRRLAHYVSSGLKDIEQYLGDRNSPNSRPYVHLEVVALWHVFCQLGKPLLRRAGPSVELRRSLKENAATIYLFSRMDGDERRRQAMWRSITNAIDGYLLPSVDALDALEQPSFSVGRSAQPLRRSTSGFLSSTHANVSQPLSRSASETFPRFPQYSASLPTQDHSRVYPGNSPHLPSVENPFTSPHREGKRRMKLDMDMESSTNVDEDEDGESPRKLRRKWR